MFTDEIYRRLPEPLRGTTALLTNSDRDIFFVSALAVVSGLLPNVTTIYDRAEIQSNLFIFINAPFGSGKGMARLGRLLGQPTHDYLRSIETPPAEGHAPERKMFFLPANSSKSGLIELLASNGRGVIFESETDTLNDVLLQDYGNFSDILRKSYQHESISFFRRLNREYYDIKKPCLSMLLTGTTSQLKKLIPSLENGLLSRFLYFSMQADTKFKNVFEAKASPDNYFLDFGNDLLKLFQWLTSLDTPLRFSFTDSQHQQFLTQYQALTDDLFETYGDPVLGLIHRFGIQYTRIAMIISTLRNYYEGTLNEAAPIICSDEDFDLTGDVMEVFQANALEIIGMLSKPDVNGLPRLQQRFVGALPDQFATSEALMTGMVLGLNERAIYRFLKNQTFFTKDRHGLYTNKSKKINGYQSVFSTFAGDTQN
ncbi:MAG: DUF3987 domain-containing protein [Sphingobacteriia bacterium]|nr:DUF3987 domain-containing protein [Sphingobacteriia bacterium]